MAAVRGLPPRHPALQALANTFERSLVTMHKMPRVWLMYLQVWQQEGRLYRLTPPACTA